MKLTPIRCLFAILAVFALMTVGANAQQDFSNVQIKANKISNNFYTLDGQGGTIGLLWNLDDDRVPWVAQLCDLTGSEARASALSDAQPPYDGQPGLATPVHGRFDHEEDYDTERLVAMIASRSQTILLPPAERGRLLATVRDLAPPAPLSFPSVCQCWRGERLAEN